ncbi:MAG: hypothetical protein SGILL_007924 [Bacillariaceae sp.]
MGVTVIYGGHGGALVPMVNAVVQHPDLKWVSTRNEHNAAEMAAAHAKLTGKLGVVIATSGPGATNLVTGLLEGVYDRLPMLAITGMKPTQQCGYAEFQDVDQSRLFAGAGLTEFSKAAMSPESVIPLLRDCIAKATTMRSAVALSIPVDIQVAPSPLPLKPFCAGHALTHVQPIHEDKTLVELAAADIVGREVPQRNVIVVGLRGCYGDNAAAITELAEALNAPILTRLDAKGCISEFHPLSFGVIGIHGKPGLESAAALISSCDRVISIGLDEETLLVCDPNGLQVRKFVEIEQDAFGLTTRYNAEHSLVGPIDKICQDLALVVETKTAIRNRKEKVDEVLKSFSTGNDSEQDLVELEKFSYMAHNSPHAVEPSDPSLPPSLQRFSSVPKVKDFAKRSSELWNLFLRQEWTKIGRAKSSIKYNTDLSASRPGYCHPAAVMQAISRVRLHDEIMKNSPVAVDVGDVTIWSSLSLTLDSGSRTLYSERLGTMGYALCAGVAAIAANPSPSGAIVLAGDGGFQMTLQELATFQQIKKEGDRLIVFVFDNQVLGRVAFGFDNALGCELQGPDYVALAKAYGGDGILLNDTAKADEVVEKALQADGLFIVHIWTDPELKADMASWSNPHVMNSG